MPCTYGSEASDAEHLRKASKERGQADATSSAKTHDPMIIGSTGINDHDTLDG
jgi:hypothetical protein